MSTSSWSSSSESGLMRRHAARNSACSVVAQRPLGSPSWGGSAAKRQTKRSSGAIAERTLQLHQEGHRAVVDQRDVHAGAEDAALRAQALAHALVERLR